MKDEFAKLVEDTLAEVPPASPVIVPVSERDADFWDRAKASVGSTPSPVVSARHNAGKTQVREVDPAFILGLGEVLTASRAKYAEGNWMAETKFSTPYESCMRHMMKFWAGEEIDEETGKHHLLHAATNLMFLHFHQTSGVGVDDRLFKKDKK